ncbi:MAG TPA: hypothetical protein VM103_00550 [Candidatus Paceibacterota bacterium]|nr:hypothetical protein [Candidatus Paceibacterota bacterium]
MATKPNPMSRITVTCVGISHLLLNPMTPEILKTLPGSGVSAGAKKAKEEIQPDDLAASKVIRDDQGRIGLPVEYLYACLINAGRGVTFSGKKNISTAETSLMPSFLTIEDNFLPFTDPEAKWVTDIRRVVNKTTKGAMAAVRPRFPAWGFTVTVEVDTSVIGLDKIRQLFNVAGNVQGLGDFRPSKKGPFGRFRIAEDGWKVSNVPVAFAQAA